MNNYIELDEHNDEQKDNGLKRFWKGKFQCYVNVAKKHKLFKKNIYKQYWLVLGRYNSIYIFKTPTYKIPTFYDDISNINYFFNKKNTVLIWCNEKKVKYSIKFNNDIEFEKFKNNYNK